VGPRLTTERLRNNGHALNGRAAGVRGTGIGCYFDDAAHNLLGLGGDEFQDL
jgi:hypothetical protein